ncbi:MAG: 3-phosphoshikimate 1-carboxyvinyltransferase [Pygmaiobacter massiliensis]|nr:3-phosphoshikimate 1-carboxyvinyltransferase [Pygmaiobacter massiliensis]
MRVRVWPGRVDGCVTAPASKSMAHRALIAAALAGGESVIKGVGTSQDIAATVNVLQTLGAQVTILGDTVRVTGCDPRLAAPGEVFCQESGSTLRFLIPIFSLGTAEHRFTGNGRLLARPQSVYAELFAQNGLLFEQSADCIRAAGPLKAGHYRLAGSISSQFFSGLAFALPLCGQDSTLEILPPFESRSYLSMTVSVLRQFGVKAEFSSENTLFIPGGQHYRPTVLEIEGDYSGAAFFALLGALCGRMQCMGLRPDSCQGDAVFFKFLSRLGAQVKPLPDKITVAAGTLTGGELDLADCPDLGPVAMVMGCFTQNGLRLLNTARLRYKESDRVDAMCQELAKLGFAAKASENEIELSCARTLRSVKEYTVFSHNDHRIAMALAVAAAALEVPTVIEGAEAVAKSYPDFWQDLSKAGIRVEVLE